MKIDEMIELVVHIQKIVVIRVEGGVLPELVLILTINGIYNSEGIGINTALTSTQFNGKQLKCGCITSC